MLSFSRASSTTSPADALRGSGPLGAREGAEDVAAGRIERSARPLPVAGADLEQAAQRLVCGAASRAVLDGHLLARQADRAVDLNRLTFTLTRISVTVDIAGVPRSLATALQTGPEIPPLRVNDRWADAPHAAGHHRCFGR